MFNLISRTSIRPVVLACLVFAGSNAALAQTPQSTPRPTPAPGDPTRPPGQDPIPGTTTPTQNPTAPPGTQQISPTRPPGTTVPPAQTPSPTPPAGNVPGGSTTAPSGTNEPLREPVIPQFQARPLPPVPSLSRLGVGSETVPLSLNEAVKRALENNNDIEVARDDVRFAETQLRALEGIFDPVFAVTPQYDKRISPQQSSLGGSGQSGTTSTTTYSLSPSVQKQFGRGGGNYLASFQNQHTNTSNSFSLLNPFYSSNLSLQFTQPLLRDRSIDNNRRQIRIQRKRLDQ